MTSDSQPSERDLWRHADFLRLWAAQAVSAFGSRITRTALPYIAVMVLDKPEWLIRKENLLPRCGELAPAIWRLLC